MRLFAPIVSLFFISLALSTYSLAARKLTPLAITNVFTNQVAAGAAAAAAPAVVPAAGAALGTPPGTP